MVISDDDEVGCLEGNMVWVRGAGDGGAMLYVLMACCAGAKCMYISMSGPCIKDEICCLLTIFHNIVVHKRATIILQKPLHITTMTSLYSANCFSRPATRIPCRPCNRAVLPRRLVQARRQKTST